MDLALSFNDSFNIDNPVDGVQEINIDVQRRYLNDGAYGHNHGWLHIR